MFYRGVLVAFMAVAVYSLALRGDTFFCQRLCDDEVSSEGYVQVSCTPSPTQKIGEHSIVELWGADVSLLNDESHLRNLLRSAAEIGNLAVIDSSFHSFPKLGVTGILLLSSSHLTVHTWPEYGYAAIDLFTCDPLLSNGLTNTTSVSVDAEAIIGHLVKELRALQSVNRRIELGYGGMASPTCSRRS